jgi:uncharacterized membrane protein YvlD (DUF360 family)
MTTVRSAIRRILRFLLLWFVDTLAMWGTAAILGGIRIEAPPPLPNIVVAAAAALTISIINLLIRPLILLLAAPLGALLIFLVGLFASAITLRLTGALLAPAFQVDGWWAAQAAGSPRRRGRCLEAGYLGQGHRPGWYLVGASRPRPGPGSQRLSGSGPGRHYDRPGAAGCPGSLHPGLGGPGRRLQPVAGSGE